MISLHPNKGENPYTSGMRCQHATSLIFSKLNSMLDIDLAEKMTRLQTYNDLALKTFIKNLIGQLQSNVRLRNPNTLEQAMSCVIEEEYFLYIQNKIRI